MSKLKSPQRLSLHGQIAQFLVPLPLQAIGLGGVLVVQFQLNNNYLAINIRLYLLFRWRRYIYEKSLVI